MDVIQAWARAGKEPEGWPEKFGYATDGGALEDPEEANKPQESAAASRGPLARFFSGPGAARRFPCVFHVGYDHPSDHIIGD